MLYIILSSIYSSNLYNHISTIFKKKKKAMVSLSNLYSKYISLTPSESAYNPSYKLALQIIILQIFYYFTSLITFFITSILLGWSFHKGLILSWKEISIENSYGLTLMFLWLLNALFSVVFITFFISRSKLVWDFVLTIHFLNFLLVWFVNGFPKNIYWWVLQCISMAVMMLLGTYMTRWIELRDTFFENLTDIELGNTTNK
jgi:hypothetical protein